MNPGSVHIHAAAWVVPVDAAPIFQGGVAVAEDRIVAVDTLARLQQQFPQARQTCHPEAILTPALVNAHIHLELSHLAGLAGSPLKTSFTGWIIHLLSLREQMGAVGEAAETAARRALDQQYLSGVGLLADIGNTDIGHQLVPAFAGTLLPFREYLGLAEQTLDKNLRRLAQESPNRLCTGHAPYSTHPRLLQDLKARARELGHPFSLHAAEPAAEGEMLRQGQGEMVNFIRERGFWDGTFISRGSGGTIDYLNDLGLLDAGTLCVHAIHVSLEETRLLADTGSAVCLCPGSNQFLGTGIAPLPTYLAQGLLPAIGTDSLASNPELSLWREMRILAETWPQVEKSTIFRMATLGGAQALGYGNRLGTLTTGKQADLLVISTPVELTDEQQVYQFLVTGDDHRQPHRIAAH